MELLIVNLAMAGVLGFVLSRIFRDQKRGGQNRSNQNRSDIPCDLSEGITEDDLLKMAMRARRGIKRPISVDVNGPMVFGTVRSQSGISEWDFSVDFNDWGHITGSYWIDSENDNSSIPRLIADRISDSISDRLTEIEEEKQTSPFAYCPECGSEVFDADARFCNKCGARLADSEPDEAEKLNASTKATIRDFVVLFLLSVISLLLLIHEYCL